VAVTVLVAVAVAVGVAVGVAVLVGVAVGVEVLVAVDTNVGVFVLVAVGTILGHDGACCFASHPNIKTVGSNSMMVRQPIIFFTFSSPDVFLNSTDTHEIQERG